MQLSAQRRNGGSVSATVDTTGGRLASLVVDGLELLTAADDDPIRWGSFPMVPWCGRLEKGRLDWSGRSHQFPITMPPHAIHGLVHTREWTQIDDTTMKVDLDDPWPFGGLVVQRFALDERSLTITMEVHADDQPMPAMAGWHPWFRRQLVHAERPSMVASKKATLSIIAESAYELDRDMIPTGELTDVPPAPWDDCMVDMVTDPVITWDGGLTLSVSSTFDHWVIYTEPAHAICVEPQSGPPNQLNTDPHIVEPGDPLIGSMTLTWS